MDSIRNFRTWTYLVSLTYAGNFCLAQGKQSESGYRDVHRINHISNRPYAKQEAEGYLTDPKIYEPATAPSAKPMNQLATSELKDSVDPRSQAMNLLRSRPADEDLYDPYPGKFSLLTFYTVSVGNFKETSSSNTIVQTQQNSPGTLGLFGNYRPRRASYSWQGSVYVSKLTGGVTNHQQPVDPPLEVGTNFYWQYEAEAFSYSAGLDYERFSNYRAENIYSDDEPVVLTNQSVTFATLGISRFFPVGAWNLLAKISLSNSVAQSEFGGQKAMFYLGLFTSSKWQFHVLYKLHHLENETDTKLNISRVGLGIGYMLF